MRLRRHSRATYDVSTGQWIVPGLVLIAGSIGGIAFAGWLFDLPALYSFGMEGHPMWPLSALGYMFLAAGFGASLARHRAAPFLLLVPLLIAACAFVEHVSRISFGIDTLLFPNEVLQIEAERPGRLGANSIVAFAFLATALLLSLRRTRANVELGNLLATASLSLGLLSAVVLLSTLAAGESVAQTLLSPLPAAIANIALAAGFLRWRRAAPWAPLPAGSPVQLPLIGLMLAVIIIVPIVPMMVAHWVASGPQRSQGTALMTVLCNVGIIGLLFWLAVDRIAELQSVTLALDIAAITLTRPDGEITYWSRGCELLYGWSAAEAVGRGKYDLLQSRVQNGSGALPTPTGSAERELVERRRDGAEISVLERSQMLEGPDGQPLCVLKLLDITERVRAENALRLSESRLAAAANAHKLSISNWDVATGRLELSPGSEQRLGFAPGGMATFDQWYAAVEPEDAENAMAILARAVADREEHLTYKYRLNQPDGQVRVIEGSSQCFYDAKGELTHLVGTHVDVTERIEREAALQLQSIIDTIPDATIVIDKAGTIRSFSAAAERMFGCDAENAIGSNVTFLMPETLAAGHSDSIARYLVTGERHVIGTTRELTARRADGSQFPIELNVGEAWLGDERIFTGVIRDVSDRLATEQRLSELSSELAHMSRQSAMSELAADLAHELNQPLSATANFLAAARMLIERGGEAARIAELLRLGEEQTLRSGEIIRRLRDFLAKREVEMRAESLDHTVREAVDLVLFGAAQFEIRLSYRLDPAADRIFADRIQVQQVLVNLLRNAVDALRNQPAETREIVIETRVAGGGMVEVSVADSGPGLPGTVKDQLYSRFATTKSGGAMGIGLSISRRIVEAHGGTLVAANRPGGGAVFHFTLPALDGLED